MSPPRPTVKRRPRGTGYLTPVLDAAGERWRFKARFPDGAGGERTVGTFDLEDDGHRELNANVEARRGGARVSCAITLLAWGERWIDAKNDRNRRNWRYFWSSIVSAAPFAGWPIDTITHQDVREWAHGALLEHVSASTGKAISRQTAKHALGLVRRSLAAAVDDGLIERSPADRVRLPRRTDVEVEAWTWLTQPEIDLVLGCPDMPPKQRSAFAVAIYAGLRQGELCALRWEQVDLREDRPRLRVVGSWDGTTKTARRRWVSLMPDARAALLAWWELRERPTAGLVWPSDKPKGAQHARGYDFGWAETRDVSHGVCWLGWRRRVGIARTVRFHDLRHTCGSHLVSGTWGRCWSLEEVQAMLGHESRDTTERYAHMAQTALDAAAAATRAPIRPGSVRADSPEVAQVVEITGAGDARFERATSGSGGREQTSNPGDLEAVGRIPDGSLMELLNRLLRGEPVLRDEAEAVAMRSLRDAGELVAAASALLGADDASWNSRLLALLELRLRRSGELAAPEPERKRVGGAA